MTQTEDPWWARTAWLAATHVPKVGNGRMDQG